MKKKALLCFMLVLFMILIPFQAAIAYEDVYEHEYVYAPSQLNYQV